jgi:hypothetical protein
MVPEVLRNFRKHSASDAPSRKIGILVCTFCGNRNKTGNRRTNVTLRCVRVTIVAVEKQ